MFAQQQTTVLVIDDDKLMRDMYSLKFSERGWDVVCAVDAEEALEKLEGGLRPDVYLVDILMPKIDGFELIGKLREKNYDAGAVIIILSNLGQQTDINRGLGLGVDGYIVKATATPSELVARAVEILNNKKRRV